MLLKLACKTRFWTPIPYRTMHASLVDCMMIPLSREDTIYAVTATGLRSLLGSIIVLKPPLKLITHRIQEKPTSNDLPLTLRRFFEFLKTNGATPSDPLPNVNSSCPEPSFTFWFDVSSETSETSQAYYKVATAFCGKKLLVDVWCKALDQTVVGNIQFLDEVLHAIMNVCKDPVSAYIKNLTDNHPPVPACARIATVNP